MALAILIWVAKQSYPDFQIPFFFSIFYLSFFKGFDAVCESMVIGRMFFRNKMSLECFQSSNLTFVLVGFVVEISSELNGLEIVSGSPRLMSVSH